MLKRLLVVLCTLVMNPTTPFAGSDADRVELGVETTGAITVPVTLNGQGPFLFMLDTGSNRSSVSSDLAARMALPVVAKAVMVTATGRQDQLVVKIDRLVAGTAARTGVLASVVTASHLSAASAGIDGIIGQDFLSAFNYTLDYRKKRVSWDAEAPSGERDVRLSLVKQDGRFLVELPQRDRTLRFVPDSGAEHFVIFERNGEAPVSLGPATRRAQLFSVTGTRDARVTVLRRLLVGSTIIENQWALVVPRNEPDAPAGDGLLPLRLFASVSFNCAEAYMVVRE
jgi:predicted aspartyl protease